MFKIVFFVVSIFAFSQQVLSASYDCTKSKNDIEREVCDNSTLSKLDEDLAGVYFEALSLSVTKKSLKKEQLNWLLNSRNPCVRSFCGIESYNNRINKLKALVRFLKDENGKYAIYYGSQTEKEICVYTLNYIQNELFGSSDYDPSSDEIKNLNISSDTQEVKLPDHLVGVVQKDFDFDNDGIEDHILAYENAGSYIWGSIYYVVFGPNSINMDGAELSYSQIHIYPCEFDKEHPKSQSCPPATQEHDGAELLVSLSGAPSVSFSARYTILTPFEIRKKTYLLLRGMNVGAKGYWALIKPTGKSTYETQCLIKRNL